MISLLGLSHCVDNDLIPPSYYNRLGLFESRTIQTFNRVLLLRWSREEWREPRLPTGWQHEAAVRFLRPHARRVFSAVHPTEPWVYKDLSINFLLPFWIDALERKPDIVFMYRDPIAVARSLERAFGIDFDRCLQIWERHNRAALAGLEGLSVLVIDYDELVSSPRSVALLLAEWLRSRGYPVPPGAHHAAAATIDKREQHWHAGSGEHACLPAKLIGLLTLLGERRGAHEAWTYAEVTPLSADSAKPRERLRLLLQRPRWWWWMAELIMPAPIARTARRLPAPRRWRRVRSLLSQTLTGTQRSRGR